MSLLDFNSVLTDDVKDVFLQEFSVEAIYISNNESKAISVQFFKDSLDKMETLYSHVICAYSDVPTVMQSDTIEIDGVLYGVVDNEPDEHFTVQNLFLQKV